jgi:hypothetical protein
MDIPRAEIATAVTRVNPHRRVGSADADGVEKGTH